MLLTKKIIPGIVNDVEELELLHCWWACEMVQLLWKTRWQFFQRLGIELPYNQTIAVLDICSGEMRSCLYENL